MKNKETTIESEKAEMSGKFFKPMTNVFNHMFGNEQMKNFIKKPKGKIMLALAGLFVFILFLALANSNNQNHRVAANKLKNIDSNTDEVIMLQQALNRLTQTMANNNNLSESEISQLKQQGQAIQARIQNLADQNDVKQLSQSLNDSNQMLSNKVAVLESNVKEVKTILQPHTFIDPKHLPFKVISVDIWDGTPYATVELDGQEDLMGINESRAGWTVYSMDFTSRLILFRNAKDQYIKIQLEN